MFDAGVPRAASLSPVAFGRRLHEAMERYEEADRSPAPPAAAVDRVRSLVADVAVVADLLERSVFGGEPIGGAAAADVAGAAQRVHQATRQPGVGWVLRDMVRPIGAPVVSMA